MTDPTNDPVTNSVPDPLAGPEAVPDPVAGPAVATSGVPAPDRSTLPRSRFGLRDLASEAMSGVFARPGRAALTAAGTVLGVAALVATLGLARTAGNQIVTRFDELTATDVEIEPASSNGRDLTRLPWNSDARVERLNGVRSVGTITEVNRDGALTRAVPLNDPEDSDEFDLTMFALSPGAFDAVKATLRTGRVFERVHDDLPLAVLGPGAADDLRIDRVSQQPAIFVGDETFVVIGILDDVARRPELLNAVLIPEGFARERYNLTAPGSVQIDTAVGAAELVGRQAPLALSPNDPDLLDASVPVEPKLVKAKVEEDTNALFLLLGGVSLLVGALGIANVTLVSVLERVGEIGLRRAVGAARRHIAAQFLVESTLLGFLGGLVGASVGVVVIVGVSVSKDWVPVLDPMIPLLAPLAGAGVGLISGVYPALRAASIEPIAALRGGV